MLGHFFGGGVLIFLVVVVVFGGVRVVIKQVLIVLGDSWASRREAFLGGGS